MIDCSSSNLDAVHNTGKYLYTTHAVSTICRIPYLYFSFLKSSEFDSEAKSFQEPISKNVVVFTSVMQFSKLPVSTASVIARYLREKQY